MNCPYCGRDITAHFPLTDAQRRVLEAVEPHYYVSSAIVADRAGYSWSYTKLVLRQLHHMGLIARKGVCGGYTVPTLTLVKAA